MICTSTWRASVDHPLHEHRGIAERLEPLGAGARERLGEAGRVVDPPDATAAATGRGLDHQRVADRVRRAGAASSIDSTGPPLHGATGTSDSLGEQLGPDLVAEPAHHVRARAR